MVYQKECIWQLCKLLLKELQKRLFTTNPQEQYSILRDIEEARRRQGSLLRQPGTYGIIGGEIPGLLNNEMTTIDIPI